MICLLASILFLLHPQSSHSLPNSLQVVLPSFLQTQHAGWWSKEPDHQLKLGSGVDANGWDLLYHLGGNGPWVEKVDGVVEGGIQVPAGCKVDMVHMVFSHELGVRKEKKKRVLRYVLDVTTWGTIPDPEGRRPYVYCNSIPYPYDSSSLLLALVGMITLLARIKATRIELKGALEFLNNWEYFTDGHHTRLQPSPERVIDLFHRAHKAFRAIDCYWPIRWRP